MWVVKSSSIVPTTIQCIGLGPNGLLVASDGSYITEYNGNRTTLDTSVVIRVDYDEGRIDGIKGISYSNGRIYLILSTSLDCIIPSMVVDGRIIPLSHDEIDDRGIYTYSHRRDSEYSGALISTYSNSDDHRYTELCGTIAIVIEGHLIYCRHGGISVARYSLVGDHPTNTSTNRIVEGRIPVNIYHPMNMLSSWYEMSRITGIALIDGYMIVTFNLVSTIAVKKDSIVAKYDRKSGALIDYKLIVSMNHMSGNGRLMVGIDTPRDSICIMNRDMDIINHFKPKLSLGSRAPLYEINRMIHITIDHEDNIHLVTDDRRNIITMDPNGTLLNIRSTLKE